MGKSQTSEEQDQKHPVLKEWDLREVLQQSKIMIIIMMIITYIYNTLINALSAHMIHINLNTIFYTHVEHSSTDNFYIKYYMENRQTDTHTHTHTRQ